MHYLIGAITLIHCQYKIHTPGGFELASTTCPNPLSLPLSSFLALFLNTNVHTCTKFLRSFKRDSCFVCSAVLQAEQQLLCNYSIRLFDDVSFKQKGRLAKFCCKRPNKRHSGSHIHTHIYIYTYLYVATAGLARPTSRLQIKASSCL